MSDPLGPRTHDQHSREKLDALALRVWESQQRDRRRVTNLVLRAIVFVVLPAIVVVAWLATAGYQRHVLEVRDGDAAFRIVSRRSPFEISLPSAEFAKPVPGGTFAVVEDHVVGNSIQPRSYDWSSYAKTDQVVTLPRGSESLEFWINDVQFQVAAGEVVSGEKRWLLKPGRTITIEVDRLPPTMPAVPGQ
jgi:hypothetical protein